MPPTPTGHSGGGETQGRITAWLILMALYSLLVLVRGPARWDGDERRYLQYAAQLINGTYGSRLGGPSAFLANGPGYPLVLVPFVYLKHIEWAPVLNAVLLSTAVIMLDSLLRLYGISRRRAWWLTATFALYMPLWREVALLHTEILAVFLVLGTMLFSARQYSTSGIREGAVAGGFLGALCLTKVVFGYAILGAAVLHLLGALLLARRQVKLRAFVMYGVTLLVSFPYLLHTYAMTGKVYYWSNYGGSQLYWMTSSYPGEWGSWEGTSLGQYYEIKDYYQSSPVDQRHVEVLASLEELGPVEADALLRRISLRSILQHPLTYAMNITANVSRMLFNFPYTDTTQRQTVGVWFYMLFNGPLLALLAFAGWPMAMNAARVGADFLPLLALQSAYFLCSSLVAAYPRMLFLCVPMAILLIGYTAEHLCAVRVSRAEHKPSSGKTTVSSGSGTSDRLGGPGGTNAPGQLVCSDGRSTCVYRQWRFA